MTISLLHFFHVRSVTFYAPGVAVYEDMIVSPWVMDYIA